MADDDESVGGAASEDGSEAGNFVIKFAKLYDKAYPGITTVAWCPKMDLVAVASWVGSKSKIAVIRSMSWDVLHAIEPEDANKCKVSAMTWSPDGRNLATGLEDGRLLLFDVESGLPWPSNVCRTLLGIHVGNLDAIKISYRLLYIVD